MAGTAVLGLALTACGSDSDGDADAAGERLPVGVRRRPPQRTRSPTTSARPTRPAPTRFRVGGILPLTGNLAFLGPPEISGVGLAVSDINAAGGVNGAQACHDIQDSGDSTDMSVSTASAGTLVASKPSVVIGAASSSVSLNVVDTFADNKITEVSPANTAVDLSGYSPWYFRTAPPDGVQGNALGTLISTDGYTKVGFLVFNDTYGTGLRNVVEETVKAAGGSCTYGCKGEGDEFPPARPRSRPRSAACSPPSPTRSSSSRSTRPSRSSPSSPSQGWDMSKVYLSDGNTSDFSEDFAKGTLEGAQGTIPGADPDADLQGPR